VRTEPSAATDLDTSLRYPTELSPLIKEPTTKTREAKDNRKYFVLISEGYREQADTSCPHKKFAVWNGFSYVLRSALDILDISKHLTD
jgi:hypothetical protein